MAIGAGGIAAIGALGQLAGAWGTGRTNRAGRQFAQEQGVVQRDWTEMMYNKDWSNQMAQWQRQNEFDISRWDAQNAYNKSMWDIQNAYNSPAAEMQRYRDAGLNPALMYSGSGGGTSPLAIADMSTHGATTPHPGSGATAQHHPEAYKPDFNSIMASVADWQVKNVTVDNLEKQGRLINAEVLQRTAETANLLTAGEKSKFELGLMSQLRQTSVDAAQANLNKVLADTSFTVATNKRAAQMQDFNIQEAMSRMRKMEVESNKLGQETITEKQKQEINDFYLRLHRMDISQHDSPVWRWGKEFLENTPRWNGKLW